MPWADSAPGADASSAIRAAITESGGAIPFASFMRLALYGPGGFYAGPVAGAGDAAPGGAGRRGDFITSPEVGPLFGTVLARFLDAEWERLGRPDEFTVVECGAGPGTLARAVVHASPRCADAMRYVAVEVSDHQRARHPGDVVSASEVPAEPIIGVVVANELLDNLPFRLVVFDGGWREALVTVGADGRFREVLGARLDPAPRVLPARAAHGARAPLQDEAARWVDQACALVLRGTVLAIDYVVPTTAQLAARPFREWLRTYRAHERGGHYLDDPGSQDITVEVALDQLREPDAVRTQAAWLRRWGIDDLVDEGRRVWSAHAATPDLDALRMRSRIREAEALLDPTGLGGFGALEWRVGA